MIYKPHGNNCLLRMRCQALVCLLPNRIALTQYKSLINLACKKPGIQSIKLAALMLAVGAAIGGEVVDVDGPGVGAEGFAQEDAAEVQG